MIDTADFVVVGAGVMGASIAYHLAERNAGRVVVLEKATVASAASGRSSALVRMHYTVREEVLLAVKSLEYFTHWTERLGRPTHFRKTGFVRIVPAGEIDHLRRNAEMQRACGANVELLSRTELQELEPAWNFEDVELAAYEPESGYGDGATVATDFLDRARELGADYEPNAEVLGIDAANGRLASVRTDSGTIATPRAVVAAGAWTDRLLRAVGVELPLDTEYHEVAILERPTEITRTHIACIDSILDIYFRSEGKTQTLVGDFYGERGEAIPTTIPSGLPSRRSPPKSRSCRNVSRSWRTQASSAASPGFYTMTPDFHGLMGETLEVEGLYCCTGFSGMGFKIAPAVGLTMAELVLDGKSTTVDISAFRPSRFAEGAAIEAPYAYADD